MPIPTPFHSRTSELNQTQEWRDWAGYYGAGLYETYHEREYFAVRNSAALFDVSPLYKYEVAGPDALRLCNRIMTRDITKCRVGQVMYSPWCDDEGQMIDDGTVARLSDQHFRITAADPSLRWFQDCGYGMDASVTDVSNSLAALSLQGPLSRAILENLVIGYLPDQTPIGALKYYRLTHGNVNEIPLTVSRTGYSGDLGYELWVDPKHALPLWDCLMETGQAYGVMPAGLVALDITRTEAGLILNAVDYISSVHALIEDQKCTPFEAGLGWAVKFTGGNEFVGRAALEKEAANGSEWALIGLDVDWVSMEKEFAKVDLPPQVTGRASRDPAPIYKSGKQVGQITTRTFSPILKKYIAIGTVKTGYAAPGEKLDVEITVEYSRRRATATVVKMPFYEPAWKRK